MKPRRRPYLSDLFFSNSAQHKDQLMRPNLEMQVDCFLPFFCCSTWLWCWEYLPCWPGSEAWLTTSSWPISLVSTPACFAVCCFCVLFYCFVSVKTQLQQSPLLWQLYRSSCFSQHHQLRTGGFCWCRLLLPACPCWQHPVHLDKGEDTGVLSSVNYTASIPYVSVPYVPLYQLKQWAYLFCLVLLESFTMPTQLQQTGHVFLLIIATVCLQCFDAVGWASGRASDQ